jgi:hypothetical protein
MRDTYFSRFPTINYNGYDSINIMSRVKLLDKVYNDNSYYYNIDLPESVRPDLLSNQLYNDPYVSWLIYLSNNVVDPYYDWALNDYDFNNLITEKYGSVSIAQSKIAYWNNNWYDENFLNITISRYNSLTDDAKKYYEPIITGKTILEYRRRQVDWKVNTNQIWEYNVTSDALLSIDDKVTLTVNSNSVGNGQVLFANSSLVRIHQVNGNTNIYTTNTISAQLVGSNNPVNITNANMIAINIPLSEQVYWSPVSYYDIENMKNRKNFTVRALNDQYHKQAVLQLKRLLNP